jgi:uncharacterized protein (DUF2336 family)
MFVPEQQKVADLIQLAHDTSEEGRLRLAERLAEVFFSDTISLTPREEKLVNDLIDELLQTKHGSIRHLLISRFAENIDIPRHIAVRVGHAPFEIAREVLEKSETLEDEDLITIVENKTTHHARAIASRKEISEAVADALVETGDLQVMRVVAENLGAKLSIRSLEMLIESARLSALLQKPILERKELTRETAVKLYWWTSQDLRRTTLERFGFGPGKLDEELNKAVENMLSTHLLQKDEPQAMLDLANWLEDRGALKIESLLQFLRAGHFRLFNIALARLANLPVEKVNEITADKEGRAMSALCRSVGIEKGKFISIYLMARGAHTEEEVVHPKELATVLNIFERLSTRDSESLLATWRAEAC